jgi:UDPglucose 6-dehydrogenase
MDNPLIGFVGQGYIGKNYADDFENRGYSVVRYSLEEAHVANKDRIKDCDIVFVAVPTPTTPTGFDDSIVRDGLSLIGPGKIAVIKSTIVPGTTAALQAAFPSLTLLYSPEFLSEATAAYDVTHPFSNIVGTAVADAAHEVAAKEVLDLFTPAPFSRVCTSTEAEIIKYTHNGSGFVEIVFFNMMYDLAQKLGVSWEPIQDAMLADPLIAHRYAKPLHKSGRGAGGHCFIKDFSALADLYTSTVADSKGVAVFKALEQKNIDLLKGSGKDLDLLKGVYGDV